MKSFKCFKDLINDQIAIFNELQQPYYAHLSKDNQEAESLYDHSRLVSDYCLKLICAHNIEITIESIINRLIDNLGIKDVEISGSLLKELFIGCILYHDLGKINPNFQVQKMNNKVFKENRKLIVQSNHSFLGAYIYSNLFFKQILEDAELNDDDKLLLYFITLLFSTAINKHHSPTINTDLSFENNQIDECYLFLKEYSIQFDESYSKSFFLGAQDIFNDFQSIISNKDVYFELFTLTKIAYSLLTASDFYATNEYMNRIKADDFGVFDSETKNQLSDKFKR
ncbi:MAG: CRISPR-associated endonuclease Cas3'' [Paludibacteraceae bacterium]